VLPVKTAFARGSARSSAVLPSVFRTFGSAPHCSKTGDQNKNQKWVQHNDRAIYSHIFKARSPTKQPWRTNCRRKM